MRALLTIVALLLGCATLAAQREPLTPVEHVLRATSGALIVADWSQTVGFRRNGVRETNPLLGPYPSVGRVNTMIGLGLAANLAVSLLPKEQVRAPVWLAVTAAEAFYVTRNFQRGYGLHLAPRETHCPPMAPSIAIGAIGDGVLQAAGVKPWQRAAIVIVGATATRYLDRGEGVHFGIGFGAAFSEIVGVALRGHP